MLSVGFTFDKETGEIEFSGLTPKSYTRYPRIYQPIDVLPTKFVAIDFETANQERCSPCAIGVAIVEDNKIINHFERLIRPHDDYYYFDNFNSDMHNITEEMVEDAPEFDSVIREIEPLLNNNVVVAHNMLFDCSVLWQTLEVYNLPKPECKTLCSYNIAKIAFPELLSFSLNSVCPALGIELKHHKASSDAVASAQVILCAGRLAAKRIEAAKYNYGYISEKGHWSPQYRVNFIDGKSEEEWAADIASHAKYNGELDGHNFVFTGTLKSMKRDLAHKIVELAGGKTSENVNKHTDYLVMGNQDFSRFTDGEKSNKTKKAESLKAKGHSIEIISEADFLRLINY